MNSVLSQIRQNILGSLHYTVKLTRAKFPANAGNFTCGLHVKRSHTQFTCVTCSLPVKTGKLTRVYAVGTEFKHRIHANCLQPNVSLPEYNGYFTSNFICGTHESLPATGMQNCLRLQAKIHAICRLKYSHIGRQKHPQLHRKIPGIAGNLQSHRG